MDIFPAPTKVTVVPIPTPLARPTPTLLAGSKKRDSLGGVAASMGFSIS